MSEPKHTPTPWKVNGSRVVFAGPDHAWCIATVEGLVPGEPRITANHGYRDANAALIVRAVNAHEQITQALEAFQRSEVSTHVESYVKWCRESGPASHVETTERERICRAAYLAGWSAMWSSVSMQVESALRAARGES